jgi:antitoxin component YwqK of YwqJK toxin-antitoxin module
MEWLKHLVIQKDKTGIQINNWKQGTSYIKYNNGNLMYEKHYVDGQMHGIQHSWYYSGVLACEDRYVYGRLHGIRKTWCNDGWLCYENNYINSVIFQKECCEKWRQFYKKIKLPCKV